MKKEKEERVCVRSNGKMHKELIMDLNNYIHNGDCAAVLCDDSTVDELFATLVSIDSEISKLTNGTWEHICFCEGTTVCLEEEVDGEKHIYLCDRGVCLAREDKITGKLIKDKYPFIYICLDQHH